MSDFETTTGAAGQAKQMLADAGQTIKAEAQSFASVAGERMRAGAEKTTETATRTLGDFASAIRRAGDELASAGHSPALQIVRKAADGLEGFSRSLSEKRPEEMINAVRDFGRRNPAAFVGGAVLLGVVLGRFLRASDHRRNDDGAQGLIGQQGPEHAAVSSTTAIGATEPTPYRPTPGLSAGEI